jgi:replicative DNA helicase
MNRRFDLLSAAAAEALLLALHYEIARVAVLPVLEDGVFGDPAERALLRAARGLWELSVDFDLDQVAQELSRQAEVTANGFEFSELERAIELLGTRYRNAPLEPKPGSRADEIVAAIKRSAPTTSSQVATPPVFRCGDIIGDVLSDAAEAREARLTGKPRGPVTGLKVLDEKIGGALPKIGTCIVLGNTGTGKTAFASQIAAQCGFPALFVTTEMAPSELFRRQMARFSSTFLNRFKSGEMTPTEVEQIALATAMAMPNLTFVDATRAFATPTFLRECAETARGNAKSILLIIDSLHTWTRGAGSGQNEYEALNDGLRSIQRLCHELQCPALVVAEQSRAAIVGGGGVNSGAGSRFIEYGAEIVLDLQASKEIDSMGEKSVVCQVAKNRHGAAGVMVKLHFNGALQRFREVDEC